MEWSGLASELSSSMEPFGGTPVELAKLVETLQAPPASEDPVLHDDPGD